MVRISRKRKFIFKSRKDEEQNKYVKIGRIDRSRYPKQWFWILFALVGATLLFLVSKLFFKLVR